MANQTWKEGHKVGESSYPVYSGVLLARVPTNSVTNALAEVAHGDADAWPNLIRLLYTDLRRLAAARLRDEHSGQTLQPTDLVHEAYLRLSEYRKKNWENRTHFFATAALVMRRILVERARRRRLRDQTSPKVALDAAGSGLRRSAVDLLDLDRALVELAAVDQRLSQIVELRYFGGLTIDETAEVLDLSPKTVKRDWAVARAFLHGRITPP